MNFGIVVFPGSNCDRDCEHVLTTVLGQKVKMIWHKSTSLEGVDAVILPGGFSYGDYLRAGAIAKISPVMRAVVEFANFGGPVLGICNGFQILLECGLLPGAMQRNKSLRFLCQTQYVVRTTGRTSFTKNVPNGPLRVPIAHAEGNYTIDVEGLKKLQDNDQIAFRYCDETGTVGDNPNGSVFDIAGVCNGPGNVVGMMPHPERASESILGSEDGIEIFRSVWS